MENFHKAATTKTPAIRFNKTGDFEINGNSYMEDPLKFYFSVTEWLKLFLEENTSIISLNVCLIYINTTSTKAILNLMNLINNASKSECRIIWQYQIDDEEMLTLGEDLQKLTRKKFEFEELPD